MSQVALSREDRYWLAHNAFSYSLALCRNMMGHGHAICVIEYLLWCAICMESSVPLMAANYLHLRTNFYVAVTQCYYFIQQLTIGETFARRALDKVHDLSRLEYEDASEAARASLQFKAATIKLGALIFKKSVFESHKKAKFPFKFKFRPTVKDILQLSFMPRTPTEKLLGEMFSSPCAQYIAILETLSDYSRRSLARGPPPPPVQPDQDVYQDNTMDVYVVRFS